MTLKQRGFSTWMDPTPIFDEGPKIIGKKRDADQDVASWFLLRAGRVKRGAGEYAHAVNYLNQARAAFEASGNEYGLACALQELAFCSGELSRNATALEYAHLAVKKFQALGRIQDLAWAYENLAYIYFYHYQYKEALASSKRARSIFLESDSPFGLAWNACNMARIYLDMSLAQKARYYYEDALKNFSKLQNEQGVALSLLGLATVYRSLCQFKMARKYLASAKERYIALRVKDHIGWCLLNEAAVARTMGSDLEAAALNKKATQFFCSVKKTDGVAWAFFQLGQVLRDQGYAIKSWQSLREGINLHKDIGNRKGIGWGENDWGMTYYELGDLDRARDCFVSAKSHAEEVGAGPLTVDADKNLANVYIDQGNLQQAAAFLESSRRMCQRLENWEAMPEILLAQCRTAFLTLDLEEAEGLLEEAEKTIQSYDLNRFRPAVRVAQGELLVRQKKVAEGVKVWKEAMTIAAKFHQRKPYTQALLGLTQVLSADHAPSELTGYLYQIDKDIRQLSSRTIKAKSLIVKAWFTFKTSGFLDSRHVTEALRIFESSGQVVLERLVLGMLKALPVNGNSYDEALKELHQKGPVDLDLIKEDPSLSKVLPLSILI